MSVFDWAMMRLTWEPRMLSILRIMTGLLFLEHGLAKIFGFPALPNHMPYQLFSLVPGLAGILEAAGGALIALGLLTRPVAFILSGEMAFAYFMRHATKSFPRWSTAGTGPSSIVSFFSTSSSLAPASGASTSYGRRNHPASRPGAAPERAAECGPRSRRIDAAPAGVDIPGVLPRSGQSSFMKSKMWDRRLRRLRPALRNSPHDQRSGAVAPNAGCFRRLRGPRNINFIGCIAATFRKGSGSAPRWRSTPRRWGSTRIATGCA